MAAAADAAAAVQVVTNNIDAVIAEPVARAVLQQMTCDCPELLSSIEAACKSRFLPADSGAASAAAVLEACGAPLSLLRRPGAIPEDPSRGPCRGGANVPRCAHAKHALHERRSRAAWSRLCNRLAPRGFPVVQAASGAAGEREGGPCVQERRLCSGCRAAGRSWTRTFRCSSRLPHPPRPARRLWPRGRPPARCRRCWRSRPRRKAWRGGDRRHSGGGRAGAAGAGGLGPGGCLPAGVCELACR